MSVAISGRLVRCGAGFARPDGSTTGGAPCGRCCAACNCKPMLAGLLKALSPQSLVITPSYSCLWLADLARSFTVSSLRGTVAPPDIVMAGGSVVIVVRKVGWDGSVVGNKMSLASSDDNVSLSHLSNSAFYYHIFSRTFGDKNKRTMVASAKRSVGKTSGVDGLTYGSGVGLSGVSAAMVVFHS